VQDFPSISRLTLTFRELYVARKAAGLPRERPCARVVRVDELTEADIRQLILTMPFKKFAQLGFLKYDRDASRLRFDAKLWEQLNPAGLAALRLDADRALDTYYSRLTQP